MKALIVKNLKKYFKIQDFVDKQTFDKFGEDAWQFFTIELLETILFIREALDKPIIINNWSTGGQFSQRGLRTNLSPLVANKQTLYLSAHLMGQAVDFDVLGMTATEVRVWLKDNEAKLPYPIRLENKVIKTGLPISWVHLDTLDNMKMKVYLFNV